MIVKIDKKTLNLVVPVEAEAGTVYIHSTPIRPETFKQHYLVLSKTLNGLYAEGVSQITGPRIAALMLQDIAEKMDVWDGVSGVKNGLMSEIRRLSNALLLTDQGWQSLPVSEAVKQGYIEDSDVEEAEGFIVFFTCISHIHKRAEVAGMLASMCRVWNTQTTSLNVTEFSDSLPTSTETEISFPAAPQSSIPG